MYIQDIGGAYLPELTYADNELSRYQFVQFECAAIINGRKEEFFRPFMGEYIEIGPQSVDWLKKKLKLRRV